MLGLFTCVRLYWLSVRLCYDFVFLSFGELLKPLYDFFIFRVGFTFGFFCSYLPAKEELWSGFLLACEPVNVTMLLERSIVKLMSLWPCMSKLWNTLGTLIILFLILSILLNLLLCLTAFIIWLKLFDISGLWLRYCTSPWPILACTMNLWGGSISCKYSPSRCCSCTFLSSPSVNDFNVSLSSPLRWLVMPSFPLLPLTYLFKLAYDWLGWYISFYFKASSRWYLLLSCFFFVSLNSWGSRLA